MSISKFYSSCQHLYGGGYRDQILGNVFDPNTIPAFLIFESPLFWGDDKISDQLPLSRMMIRNIETFDDVDTAKIFFDRAYPDRMKKIFNEMVEKYSENVATMGDNDQLTYIFTPDIDSSDQENIKDPYMDKLGIQKMPYIGINTKSLYLNRLHDWSNCKINPGVKIKELVIETNDIPKDLLKINLNPEWVKFKFLTINTLEEFNRIKTDSIAFDKCKFNTKIFEDINKSNPDIKKLQIVSCDVSGDMNLSQFKKLEELHVIYTIDSLGELKDLIENLSIKRLVLSGDLIKDKSSKEYIQVIRKKGIKIEIVGPVI